MIYIILGTKFKLALNDFFYDLTNFDKKLS